MQLHEIYDEKYSCSNVGIGKSPESKGRYLILSPNDKYFATELLTDLNSKTANITAEFPEKIHGFPVTISGLAKCPSDQCHECLTFIELPHLLNDADMLDALNSLKDRCFDKPIIVIDWAHWQDMEESETLDVFDTFLKLMVSAYRDDFRDSSKILVMNSMDTNMTEVTNKLKNQFGDTFPANFPEVIIFFENTLYVHIT